MIIETAELTKFFDTKDNKFLAIKRAAGKQKLLQSLDIGCQLNR